jgi:folate-binding protein YgfZ
MSGQLEALERANGAVFAPFADRALPARFTTVDDEWAAVRRRCGLLDAGLRGLLRLTGSDRATFLQGMVSNDVVRLQNGEGTYAALLTQQGKVVSDLRVFVLPDELWLDVPAACAGAVRENLQRYIIADDVEFAVDDGVVPLVVVEGPQADRVLLAVSGESVTGLPPFAHRAITFDGVHVRAAAVTHTAERGYLLFGDPAGAASLWNHCRAAGAEPVGMDAVDVLRIEAGIPWYRRDFDDTTLISEVGLEAAISYTKGCYLGQEVVERVAARGQVHRKLVGLLCDGRQVPPPGSKLLRDARECGWITSAVWSPARNAVIALGYARRESWDLGTELNVALAETSAAARVVGVPFYTQQPS